MQEGPPKVKPRNHGSAQQQQPANADVLPKVPFRMVAAGPSGCGKTEAIVSMILDMYRARAGKPIFQGVFVFSPSVEVDSCWAPVKDFVKKELKVNLEKERCFFDKFDTEALQDILSTQKRVTQLLKDRGAKQLYGVLLVIDDFADDVQVVRNSPLLWETYVRGRHSFVSTIIATQRYRQLAPIIRINATDAIFFRFRSQMELKAMLEENSAVFGQRALEEMYHEATKEPYSFLYLKLGAKKPEDFAWKRFEERLAPLAMAAQSSLEAGGGELPLREAGGRRREYHRSGLT